MALEEKRRSQHAAKYWASDPDEKYREFYNTIEDDFKKFTADIKLFGMLGGNRSSKTERGVFLDVAWLMGKEYFRDEPAWRYVKDLPIPDEGVNIWVVGLDFTVIKDVLWNEKLRAGTRKSGLLPALPSPLVERCSDGDYQVTVNVNGRRSTLTCKSAESGASKFQAASVDLLHIDEECDEGIFLEAYQRTADCGGKIILTLTPLADTASGASRPWVHGLYKEAQAGNKDYVFIKLNTLNNPYIPEREKERLQERWSGHPEEGARLYGDFVSRGGLVYDLWDRKTHVIKPFRLEREWKRIVSIDPAPTGITAAVWAAISPRNDVYVYRTYYASNKTISDHAKDILIQNGGDSIDMYIIDPFAGVQRNAETHKSIQDLYREHGVPVRLAPKAEDFGVEIMREYLQAAITPTARHPRMLVFNSCEPLIDEIEQYSWDIFSKGPNKGLNKGKPVKRKDHAINATQYMLSLRPKGRKGGGIVEYQPTNSYS